MYKNSKQFKNKAWEYIQLSPQFKIRIHETLWPLNNLCSTGSLKTIHENQTKGVSVSAENVLGFGAHWIIHSGRSKCNGQELRYDQEIEVKVWFS